MSVLRLTKNKKKKPRTQSSDQVVEENGMALLSLRIWLILFKTLGLFAWFLHVCLELNDNIVLTPSTLGAYIQIFIIVTLLSS